MNELGRDNDDACWGRARGGDAVAFGELFDRHCDVVYNFSFRRTGSWDLADDIVSTVFLEAWRQRDTVILHEGSLRPWLLGVAHNQLRRWWRTNDRARHALTRLSAVGEIDDHAVKVAERVDDERRLRRVLTLIQGLPDGQRDVLLLSAWEQLSYEEIAVVLSLPVGTVRSRLSRARSALATLDGTEGPEGASPVDARSHGRRWAGPVDGGLR